MISGERFSVRLPSRIVPIWVSEPIGLARAAPDILDAGDERGGHRAEADAEHAELALGRRDLPDILISHCYRPFARASSRALSTSRG